MGRGAERGAGIRAGVALPERYELMRRIATGGMASVWCAQDHTLDRRVAVKLLAERFANDDLAGRRFKREARAAARLSGHPNVVTIYDVGQAGATEPGEPERPFIVMEYLPGGTAAEALRAGEVDASVALAWLRQAAAALDYAHGRGVIHRDVKLANFLLDRGRVLHVADFGIAQIGTEDTLSTSGEVLGTAAYLAPERALGHPATEAADRYALAVAAFELLTGERPFAGDTLTAVARQHLEEPPPRATTRKAALPQELDEVLIRGMAKRPEDRFPTAMALVEAIEQATPSALHDPRVPSEPTHETPPQYRLFRAEERHLGGSRGRVAALAAFAALLAALAFAATQLSGGTTPTSQRAARTSAATHRTVTHAARPKRPATHATRTPRTSPAAAPPTSAAVPPPAVAPSVPAPASAPPASAAALETQGHQLMQSGNYATAIPVLRRAVSAASPGSLTYAYALYDLGRSLRLAGDPRAAVPVLWRRLQIPNQTQVVRAELTLALEALGRKATAAGSQSRSTGARAANSAGGQTGQGD
jgi:eukaryotic-like serine/threonine-protein kinase